MSEMQPRRRRMRLQSRAEDGQTTEEAPCADPSGSWANSDTAIDLILRHSITAYRSSFPGSAVYVGRNTDPLGSMGRHGHGHRLLPVGRLSPAT